MGNISDTRCAISVGNYRCAVAKLITELRPDLFVTLAFNASTTVVAAEKRLRDLQARMDHRLLGHRWQKLGHRRTRYAATVEHPDTNLHVHVALVVPEDRADQVARFLPELWRSMIPAGSINVQRVHGADGVGRYLAKMIAPSTSERLLISQNAGATDAIS